MGWFSRFVKKVIVEPVEAIVFTPIMEHVIEPVLEHVVEPLTENILEPIASTVSLAVLKAVELISSGVDTLSQTLVKLTDTYTAKIALDAFNHWVDNDFVVTDPYLGTFDPVDGAELKRHETIHVEDWTDENLTMVRDVVALTQVAFADFSELSAPDVNAIDSMGYVIDESAIYDAENWHTGIETWVQEGFEIIRVQEATLAPFYEANVVLFQSRETVDYTIGIGGTDGNNDFATDAALTLFGGTPGFNAISEIIADLFENDIVGGQDATVNLVGVSLGGAEALQQYSLTPELFDDVFVFNSAGLGGAAGTYYERNDWDGVGDANITEINSNDPDFDANDLVTSLGFVGAGQTFEIGEVTQSMEIGSNELIDSHLNHAFWASLPGGEYPDDFAFI